MAYITHDLKEFENDTFTVTLTRAELEMLVSATNIMHIRYNRPEVTEAARKTAQEYADLCHKLYMTMIQQDDARLEKEVI